ncbi:MAG: cytochrome d ubiquinol oxidase subunit II [Bacteroidetes bacterium]|nr:MAG: cytochrome d ubiquinol oxidase subunit II [Bacteroidota bacterium]RLD83243.1 MAG: cytochrome d ubiquinol oxidase subunit II [Bacteroidota bacterium]
MEIIWAVILVMMLTIFIVMDGADFGAGIIHLFFAKTEKDKKSIINAIGPFWDGNEVWLIAGGGVLFLAFPTLYASSFSGFYLPLIMVLWLLIFRGIGLELRNLVDHNIWKTIWDKAFGISSLLLALFFGAALGNVVRGVNLGGIENGIAKYESIYFFTPLWNENFSPINEHQGVLDWFTVIIGVIAIVALAIQGATWIIFKTNSDLNSQLKGLIKKLAISLIPLTLISITAWFYVKPNALDNYFEYFLLWIFPLGAVIGIIGLIRMERYKKDYTGFIFSTLFIVSSFASTAAALFPVLLPNTNDINPSLTVFNAAASEYSLNVGIVWWIISFVLVIGYFYFIHRIFKGKLDNLDYH